MDYKKSYSVLHAGLWIGIIIGLSGSLAEIKWIGYLGLLILGGSQPIVPIAAVN